LRWRFHLGNSVVVHLLLSHNGFPMDDALVIGGSHNSLPPSPTPQNFNKCKTIASLKAWKKKWECVWWFDASSIASSHIRARIKWGWCYYSTLVVLYWGQYKYKAEIASQSYQLDELHQQHWHQHKTMWYCNVALISTLKHFKMICMELHNNLFIKLYNASRL